ncbi:glycosyl hydrolase 2 galactose-binding domain-containing protein [Viscerimonas tarda]
MQLRFYNCNKPTFSPVFLLTILLLAGVSCSVFAAKRNIAFRRAVYQSSAVNFDATGHLATDGIFTEDTYVSPIFTDQYGSSPQGETPNFLFDDKSRTKWLTFNKSAWVQIQFPNQKSYTVTSYSITSGNDSPPRDPKDWTVEGSNNGSDFVVLDSRSDEKFERRFEPKKYKFENTTAYKFYRLNIKTNGGDERTQVTDWNLFDKEGKSVIDRPAAGKALDSRWISKTANEEWIYVDLGTFSKIDEVKLYWAKTSWAAEYKIQLSNNAKDWQTVYTQANGKGGIESCAVKKEANYVRLLCQAASGGAYALVEMEVYGSNKLEYKNEPQSPAVIDNKQYLRDGNWRLQRASEVGTQDGKVLSQKAFDDNKWLPAKAPGTVLRSYLLAGAIPDPNYGDQQLLISDSFFTADFWYRNQFKIPSAQKGKLTWLNFDAINWKAEVFLNGNYLGRIDGAFIRGKFDITNLANYGGDNYLAVLIHKNDTPGDVTLQNFDSPGKNGGALGADNPTIHASVGWDWVPTIRGRNTGIYNDVYLSYTQDVQIMNPWIITDLDVEHKDFSKAKLTVKTELHNANKTASTVVVKGIIQPGNIVFESQAFTLNGDETREVDVTSKLVLNNPELWWPNTYGKQPLYTAKLTAYIDGKESDHKEFKFGVREYSYDVEKPMTIYCNGVRIVCRGGNWGMDDSNLAATEDDYDIKVRLHAEANLTMIRNWVGMTGNEAFYRACDKYGVLIWDDFWLANPGDGPNPDDEALFLTNTIDKIKRNRHHAAIALYCGRNEGMPPKTLDAAFLKYTTELDGTRHYIPHSAAETVSGFGPYSAQDTEWYFKNTGQTLHSERGMVNMPSIESLQRMIPPDHLWPIDDVWGIHDFTLGGAQGGGSFINKTKRYGEFTDLASFVSRAQMVNYESHKAMFEAVYTNRSNGMLMWMSQSAWPSMVWQTYDYYYDTNAGYFGIKKGNQPVNAIYNQETNGIVLCNTTGEDKKDLRVTLEIYDINGKLVKSQVAEKSMPADTREELFKAPVEELSGIVFIKTKVQDAAGKQLADNFTWINASKKYDYAGLAGIPEAKLSTTLAYNKGYKVTVDNTGNVPALMIRIKAVNSATKELVLPVYYEDNYFSLMPGESKDITIEFNSKYIKGGKAEFYIEGFNKQTEKIK